MSWFRCLFLGVVVLFSSCTAGRKTLKNTSIQEYNIFPYDFSQLKAHPLAAELTEISGLTYDVEHDVLLAVQDENGLIFTLDTKNGNVLSKDKFHKDGDYEGITTLDGHVYVLKSSGTIYELKDGETEGKPGKIKGKLKKDYDLEGLTYDPISNGLLVSCKEPTENEDGNSRCVFRFDIDTKEMSSVPFLLIKREEIKNYIVSHFSEEEAIDKFGKIMNPDVGYLHLGPSGLAIHPYTENIYVLSSKSKCLLVYDRATKALVYLKKLDKKTFEQPEGICFDPLGNLFISSEGKDNPAQLVFIPISKIRS